MGWLFNRAPTQLIQQAATRLPWQLHDNGYAFITPPNKEAEPELFALYSACVKQNFLDGVQTVIGEFLPFAVVNVELEKAINRSKGWRADGAAKARSGDEIEEDPLHAGTLSLEKSPEKPEKSGSGRSR